jgi:hypothetical protein
MTAPTLPALIAGYKPTEAHRYGVCAPIDGTEFAEPLKDFRGDVARALEYAAGLRAHGIECRTYEWDREPAHQIIDGGAA